MFFSKICPFSLTFGALRNGSITHFRNNGNWERFLPSKFHQPFNFQFLKENRRYLHYRKKYSSPNEQITLEKPKSNQEIESALVLLINEEGKAQEILKTEALQKAINAGLDLVQVGSHKEKEDAESSIPVCKILSLNSYMLEKKKYRKNKNLLNDQHRIILKEMRFSTKINEHDVGYKVKQISEYLTKNYRVKVNIYFKSKKLLYDEMEQLMAVEILRSIQERLYPLGYAEQAKIAGKTIHTIFYPHPKGRNIDPSSITYLEVKFPKFGEENEEIEGEEGEEGEETKEEEEGKI